jgi:3-hydroxy-2-methylpyridine-4,5-dicarboxylate 4-decarboxylase
VSVTSADTRATCLLIKIYKKKERILMADIMISLKKLECGAKTAEEAKEQLVLASRIMGYEGILDGLGHLSIRNPENPDTFFQSRSLSPEFITINDIMEIDLEGNVVKGIEGKKPYGERILHARILAARPDVNCVFHGHPLPLIPFTVCKDIPLLPVMNYGALFYNGIGMYDDSDVSSGMIVVTREEGERIARALGDKYCVLMRGHGITTVGENMPQTVLDTILLVQNAKVQLDCLKIGGTPKICTEEEGRAYRTLMHGDNSLNRCWNYYVGRAKRAFPDIQDLGGEQE